LWTAVGRTGRISWRVTGTPREAACQAASQPASPPPTIVIIGFPLAARDPCPRGHGAAGRRSAGASDVPSVARLPVRARASRSGPRSAWTDRYAGVATSSALRA
jgi:hypothetical protein